MTILDKSGSLGVSRSCYLDFFTLYRYEAPGLCLPLLASVISVFVVYSSSDLASAYFHGAAIRRAETVITDRLLE